ncbi:hypothetical protein SK128_020803, partial [Halocaridina rubra]
IKSPIEWIFTSQTRSTIHELYLSRSLSFSQVTTLVRLYTQNAFAQELLNRTYCLPSRYCAGCQGASKAAHGAHNLFSSGSPASSPLPRLRLKKCRQSTI